MIDWDNFAFDGSGPEEILFFFKVHSRQERADVKLQIIDEGSGIPPEEIKRIFDSSTAPRSRIRSERHRAWTGHLPWLREAMGGSITAANRSDRPGAVFTITLPVPKPAARLDTAA